MVERTLIDNHVSKDSKKCDRISLNPINSELSKRITVLRFVLSVFVVFIHNNMTKTINFADGNIHLEIPFWIRIINDTFSGYWGGIAVPTFFIISGYLFFAKPKPLGVTLKSKFKGIILPYILWTVLAILMFFIAQSFSFAKPYFTQSDNIISNWELSDYFSALWSRDIKGIDDHGLNSPFVNQFWYIRDLLIMMLASPLIKYLAGKYPVAFITLVTVLNAAETLHITDIQYGITQALFYFTLGFYAVKHIVKIMEILDSIKWGDFIIAYLFSYVLTIYTTMNSLPGSSFIVWFNQLITICLIIKIAGIVCKKNKVYEKLSYLSGFSFWIFAAHLPFVLPVMRKICVKIIPMHGIWILVYFFGVVVLCIGCLLIVGILFRKYIPKFYALLNGGR